MTTDITEPIVRPPPPDVLRADVRDRARNRPGVYRMIGPAGEVLYVGKSIRVRTRLLSYFRADRGEKAAQLLAHAHRIEWDDAPSEFAALLQEMRLIREFRPPYNVQHKRDRSFCFIKVTREEAPRLLAVFEVRDDGGWYAGPFQEPQRVREVVREVVDLLELRDCAPRTPLQFADQLDLFGREQTPRCLRADLGRCLGACAGRCTRSEYRARAEQARRFLDGDADAPLAILQARMAAAADRLHFEYAAELRDRAERIATAREELVARRGAIDALTFVYEPEAPAEERRVYVIHRGIVRAELPSPRTADDRAELVQRARAILRRAPSAARVSTMQASEMLLLARWFRMRPEEARNIWQDPTKA